MQRIIILRKQMDKQTKYMLLADYQCWRTAVTGL